MNMPMMSVKAIVARLDAGLFVDQRTAEHAFQRAHQAAFGAVGVFADGAAAECRRLSSKLKKMAEGSVTFSSSSATRRGRPFSITPTVELEVPKSMPPKAGRIVVLNFSA